MEQQVQERLGETTGEPYKIREGRSARRLERRTARVPSTVFLWAAGASILGSLVLQLTGRRENAIFVGQWAPTFLLLGVYNKQVKTQGHD